MKRTENQEPDYGNWVSRCNDEDTSSSDCRSSDRRTALSLFS